jgi:hypothetical protein
VSEKALEVINQRKQRFNKARDSVLKSIKKMMVRDKNGVLVPTSFGKDVLRERRLAKGSVSEMGLLSEVAEKHDNVSQMLSGFENGRLACGGFWDWEDHQGDGTASEALVPTGKAKEESETGVVEMPSNADLYRAAQLAATRGTVTVQLQGQRDLGDLTFAAPPSKSEEEWLIDCVMLFRERLDLSLFDEVPKPQQYIEKLKSIVRGHAVFIDDQLAGLDAVRSVLEEVTEGDRSGGDDNKSGRRTDFDSEMVQEQQQEEEKQKEQEQEQQDQVEHDNYPCAAVSRCFGLRLRRMRLIHMDRVAQLRRKEDTEWKLADLSVGKSGQATNSQLIGKSIMRLNTFRMVRRSRPLAFPDFVLATENHVDHVDVARNRRLKNVEVLMQWQPEKDDASYVVLLSLREAQTLRRAVQAKSPTLPPIILFTVNGEVLAQSTAARRMQSEKAVLLDQRDIGRQCARFFGECECICTKRARRAHASLLAFHLRLLDAPPHPSIQLRVCCSRTQTPTCSTRTRIYSCCSTRFGPRALSATSSSRAATRKTWSV